MPLVSSTLIPQTTIANYLGIIINLNLKFHHHILSLEHKISRTVGILSKVCNFLFQSALLNICYALIYGQLTYVLTIWGFTFPSYLKNLNLQNKAVKTIDGGIADLLARV